MSFQDDLTGDARALLARMLRERDCDEWDVRVTCGREQGFVGSIAHDQRGAPYVVDPTGAEVTDTFVSFSDEGDVCTCAWLRVAPASPVVGLGIDLVDASDFRTKERGTFLVHALFGEGEARTARATHPEDASLGYAFAFGAKEAAFKATSQSLRSWCLAQGKGMFFEVRDFALADDATHSKGVRHAVDVFAALGIDRIELGHVARGDLVLVIAVALSRSAVLNAATW